MCNKSKLPLTNHRWRYSVNNISSAPHFQFCGCGSETAGAVGLQMDRSPFNWGIFKLKPVRNVLLRFRVERHVSWKRCVTGFEICFLLFVGCVRNVSPISSNMYINHAVLKRQRTMSPSEVIYKCVRCSSVYTTIEDIRRNVCRKSFIVTI